LDDGSSCIQELKGISLVIGEEGMLEENHGFAGLSYDLS